MCAKLAKAGLLAAVAAAPAEAFGRRKATTSCYRPCDPPRSGLALTKVAGCTGCLNPSRNSTGPTRGFFGWCVFITGLSWKLTRRQGSLPLRPV